MNRGAVCMKIVEIVVGERYFTRVSGELVEVIARAIVEDRLYPSGKVVRKVRCVRADTGNWLPKLRNASALRKRP